MASTPKYLQVLIIQSFLLANKQEINIKFILNFECAIFEVNNFRKETSISKLWKILNLYLSLKFKVTVLTFSQIA